MTCRLVAEGEAMLSPAVTRTLISQFGDGPANSRRAHAVSALDKLSER